MDKHERQYTFECEWLGTLIKEPSLWEDKNIHIDHFHDAYNKNIYKLISRFIEKKTFTPHVWRTLTDSEWQSIGGKGRLEDVKESCMTTSVEHFFLLEKEMHSYLMAETIKNKAKEIHNMERYDEEKITELLNEVNDISEGIRKTHLSFDELLIRTHDELMNKSTEGLSGANTGYENLNRLTDGWQGGTLITIGARPSVGKTSISGNMALRSASKNVFNTFIPSETGNKSIVKRFISVISGLPLGKVNNPNKYMNKKELEQYHKAVNMLHQMPLHIESLHYIHDIRQLVRDTRKKRKNEHLIFYVDHLGHLKNRNRYTSNNAAYEDYMKELKDIAVDYNVVIILLSQLSRESAKSGEKPSLTSFRDSGSIEQISDICIILHRPNYFLPPEEREERDKLEFCIVKNRDGATGSEFFEFIGETTRVKEWQD